MTEADIRDVKVIHFSPEQWGQLDRFQNFFGKTYRFDNRTMFAPSAVASQFNRAVRLLALAHRLAPTLQEDRDEMAAKGSAIKIFPNVG